MRKSVTPEFVLLEMTSSLNTKIYNRIADNSGYSMLTIRRCRDRAEPMFPRVHYAYVGQTLGRHINERFFFGSDAIDYFEMTSPYARKVAIPHRRFLARSVP